jgi:hypothetical protein
VLPVDKQARPTHFVRDLKWDGRYKSQLVAGGHKQRPGVDFEETFAPVLIPDTAHYVGGCGPRRPRAQAV